MEADYLRALIASPFRTELERDFGRQLFHIAEMTVKTFALEIVEDLKRNNELSTEYYALIASAQILFDGQELTLSQMGKYLNVADRSVRKAAHKTKTRFL